MSIGLAGHSFAFTIGRGNEVQRVAIDAFADVVLGRSVDSVIASPGELWSATVGDSQFRWLGPEKGVVHMAAGALLNAVWDLRARVSGRPLWLLLAEMDPAEVVEAVPFDHIEDAITPDDALAILRERAATRADRIETLLRDGYPAYTTTPGWLGYSDEKMTRLAKQVVADGFRQIKLKVGADLDDDVRRTRLAREAIGDSVGLAVDANQVWAAHEAGPWINALEPARLAWVEEPTHPDDVLGHQRIRDEVRPIPIATGEHCANRVMFKQFLQADAIDIVQLDAARVWAVSTRTWRSCCSRQSSTGRCVLTLAGSGCASSFSTWRCSTTSESPARWRVARSNTSTISTSTSSTPCASSTGAIGHRLARGCRRRWSPPIASPTAIPTA